MGACTIDIRHTIKGGGSGQTLMFGTLTLSNSYATGGDTIPFPGSQANRVFLVGHGGGYVLAPDIPNTKLKVYRQRDPAAAGGADIPLPEVTAGTDLSSVTVPFQLVTP